MRFLILDNEGSMDLFWSGVLRHDTVKLKLFVECPPEIDYQEARALICCCGCLGLRWVFGFLGNVGCVIVQVLLTILIWD